MVISRFISRSAFYQEPHNGRLPSKVSRYHKV